MSIENCWIRVELGQYIGNDVPIHSWIAGVFVAEVESSSLLVRNFSLLTQMRVPHPVRATVVHVSTSWVRSTFVIRDSSVAVRNCLVKCVATFVTINSTSLFVAPQLTVKNSNVIAAGSAAASALIEGCGVNCDTSAPDRPTVYPRGRFTVSGNVISCSSRQNSSLLRLVGQDLLPNISWAISHNKVPLIVPPGVSTLQGFNSKWSFRCNRWTLSEQRRFNLQLRDSAKNVKVLLCTFSESATERSSTLSQSFELTPTKLPTSTLTNLGSGTASVMSTVTESARTGTVHDSLSASETVTLPMTESLLRTSSPSHRLTSTLAETGSTSLVKSVSETADRSLSASSTESQVVRCDFRRFALLLATAEPMLTTTTTLRRLGLFFVSPPLGNDIPF